MLTISGLITQAGSFRLGPIDLTVAGGRVLVVLGPSGAGKSVLLDTIAGFRVPQRGQVQLHGRDISGVPPERRGVGVVFQDAALFPNLSVRNNIGFGPRVRGGRCSARVDELLERFGLVHLADRKPRSLSGGERQRVALARALAAQPAVLLLDEPLSALDQPVREELRDVLHQVLRDLRVPTIHVTHDRGEALRIADELAILAAGTLRQVGSAAQLTRHPSDEISARLLGWAKLGAVTRGSTGLRVGDLQINNVIGTPDKGAATTLYYRPEEVLIDSQDQSSSVALRCRAPITSLQRTVPLARVLLQTNPPITALILHRQLDGLDPLSGSDVEITVPLHAVRAV